MFILIHYGKRELIYPTMTAFGALIFGAAARWELRKYWWFWLVMGVIAVIHAAGVLLLPWRAGWIPAPFLWVVAGLDVALIYGILTLCYNLARQQSDHSDGA